MAHKIAKLILEHADNFLERTEAVRTALSLGMPLGEIEEYLDWLDAVRPELRERCQPPEVIDLDAARTSAAAHPSPNSAPPGAAGDQAEQTTQSQAERSSSRKGATDRASSKPGPQPKPDEPCAGPES